MKGVVFLILYLTLVKPGLFQNKQVLPIYSLLVNRIVGGKEAAANTYPFQAGLFITSSKNEVSLCGGTLLSKSSVLTAAHCLYKSASSVEVILGSHKINTKESTQQRFVSTKFIVHKEYDPDYVINDIAIIILEKEATLNSYVQLVTLPTKSDISNTYEGSIATAIGWGYDSDSSKSISSVLKYAQLNVITNAECSLTYPRNIQNTNICTSGKGGIGTCIGDSGGPIFVSGKQVGIVSFGSPKGCEVGAPSVYTRITSFLDWIQTNIDVKV